MCQPLRNGISQQTCKMQGFTLSLERGPLCFRGYSKLPPPSPASLSHTVSTDTHRSFNPHLQHGCWGNKMGYGCLTGGKNTAGPWGVQAAGTHLAHAAIRKSSPIFYVGQNIGQPQRVCSAWASLERTARPERKQSYQGR